MGAMGCSIEEARAFKEAYDSGFPGITEFKQKGSQFVRNNGYVLMCKETGHRMNWWDWNKWMETKKKFTPEFWENYRTIKEEWKRTEPHDFWELIPEEIKMVTEHFQAASKWDRMALNGPTQGTGAICLKDAAITLFNWIVDNGYFNKVKFCALVHDEMDVEFPEEIQDFPKILERIMEDSAAKYCHSLPIPAEASVEKYWVH